jgi:hypothetical protein
VGGGGLRDLVMGLGLHRVDEVREAHGVLDEEDRDVIPHEIEIPLLGVELHGEAAHVPAEVGRAARADDRGEAHEHRRLLRGVVEEGGAGETAERLVDLEEAMGGRSVRVHNPLGNPLVIEVGDFLAQDEVFQEGRPTRPRERAPQGADGTRRRGNGYCSAC